MSPNDTNSASNAQTPTSKPRRGRPPKSEAEIAAEAKYGKPKITERQQRILNVITDSLSTRGFPPTMREIAQAVGLSSTSSVSYQLDALVKKGYLRREDNKPRAVNIQKPADDAHNPATAPTSSGVSGTVSGSDSSGNVIPVSFDDDTSDEQPSQPVYVPVVGSIAAGNPILAEQHVEDRFPLPQEIVGTGEIFLLHVKGVSMIDAGIHDGDWVAVRSQNHAEFGDFVAAMIDGEATVKEYRRDKVGVWLYPYNDEYEPISAENATILGKVTAVLRKL